MSAPAGMKAIIAAAIANLIIALSKLGAWVLTGSSAMLAEAVHSFADTSNQFLLILGTKQAKKQANETHQFGFGRSRYLAAFIVSIVLFTLGGLFALYEAYHKFSQPKPITSWHWVPVLVLVVAIIAESFSLKTALEEAHEARGEQSLWMYIRSSRAPEIPVVLLEDVAALLGLVFALGGVGATLATGDGRWDAVGSAAIGVLLVVVAAFLAQETTSLLMGESVMPLTQAGVRHALVGASIKAVMDLRTMHVGPDEVLIAAKVDIDPDAHGTDIAQSINAAEERVRALMPQYTCFIFIEPDLSQVSGISETEVN
ncbi:MAG: cation transporter [Actinomycetaceae bacterium]|nr:cation transporter [Actinomycetaceae bacterium]